MFSLLLFPLLQNLFLLLLVFGAIFFLLRYYLKNRPVEAPPTLVQPDDKKVVLPLRLQAYERFVLFLERIHPGNLLMRLNNPELTSVQLQTQLVRTIREEFEYNLSQQLYISAHAWGLIKNAKEEMIAMINKASSRCEEQAKASELVKAILEVMVERGKLPSELALDEIKKEVQQLF